jgi:carbonic anhydrase
MVGAVTVLLLAAAVHGTLAAVDAGGSSDWPLLCRHGRLQSPIDIAPAGRHGAQWRANRVVDRGLQPLRFGGACRFARPHAKAEHGALVLRDATVRCWVRHPLRPAERYRFDHAVLRLAAEHRSGNRSAAMEAQLVFRARRSDAAPLVVAVAIDAVHHATHAGRGGMASLLQFAAAADSADAVALPLLPHLLPRGGGYATYVGSLTTPPCREGVRWIVMTAAVPVPAVVVAAYIDRVVSSAGAAWHLDARAVQPPNGRDIRVFASSRVSVAPWGGSVDTRSAVAASEGRARVTHERRHVLLFIGVAAIAAAIAWLLRSQPDVAADDECDAAAMEMAPLPRGNTTSYGGVDKRDYNE